MPHLLGFINSNPALSMLAFLSGLSLALCGYLGHTRPLRSGLNSICVFLFILIASGVLRYDLGSGDAGDFVKIFAAPLTGLLGLVMPLVVLWLHLRRASKKLKAARGISRRLRPFVFAAGILIAFISLPGLFKYLAWFI